MNKYIRRHIVVEYWFVIIFAALFTGLSAVYIFNPQSVLTSTSSEIVAHLNTVILIVLAGWLWFLKKKVKESD